MLEYAKNSGFSGVLNLQSSNSILDNAKNSGILILEKVDLSVKNPYNYFNT